MEKIGLNTYLSTIYWTIDAIFLIILNITFKYFLNTFSTSYRYFLFFFFFSTFLFVGGCSLLKENKPPLPRSNIRGLDLLGGHKKITIPFDSEQGFIIVKLKMQRTFPLKFIFDTGAENTVIFNKMYSDILNISYDKRVPILGSDLGKTMHAKIARNVWMKMDGQLPVKRDVLILEEDYLRLYETLGIVVDGILGGEFIRGLVLEIDYKKEELVLHHPDYFNPPSQKEYEVLPVKIKNYKPYLMSEVISEGDTAMLEFLVDTGASLSFLTHVNSHPALHLPEIAVPGRIGIGLGGDLMGYMGLLDYINLGSFEYTNVLTSYQDINETVLDKEEYYRNGLIGNRVMSRFHIMIDYKNNSMYWKPTEKDYNKKFDFDKSGLTIFAYGPKFNNFYIKSIVDDSPAARIGLKSGDVIVKFNGKKNTSLNLGKINDTLRKEAGKKIKIKVLRNEEELEFEFRLEDLFAKSMEKIKKSKIDSDS